jgi:hypothetical protein
MEKRPAVKSTEEQYRPASMLVDRGLGDCWLKDARRRRGARCLRFSMLRYTLHGWVIMPTTSMWFSPRYRQPTSSVLESTTAA